jgi:hypothetical protein
MVNRDEEKKAYTRLGTNGSPESGTGPQDRLSVVRYSLLVRHSGLSHDEFLRHYEKVHGPLAISQPGFAKYTIEYVQNHCLEKIAGVGYDIDGVTATTQLPRPDYRVGFFQEPDYANVQADERYLFDLGHVRSVLSRRSGTHGTGGRTKIITISRDRAHVPFLDRVQPNRWRVSALDAGTASALGFGDADFAFDTLVEAWTNSDSAKSTEMADSTFLHAWRVREIVMMPLSSSQSAGEIER